MSSAIDSARFRDLLVLARQGDDGALGEILDACRPFLKEMAKGEIDEKLGIRIDASDVVQQTCLSAIRKFPTFDGAHRAQLLAWLKQIHRNNIVDTIRRHKSVEKRDLAREERFRDSQPDAAQVADQLGVTPSQKAMRGELDSKLDALLADLPADQQTVVRMRYFEKRAFREIAEQLGRSEDAVAGLLKRGLDGLRRKMGKSQDDGD
ncbi:MAG: hypothetical protein CMJ48_00390 [Planctomycetaceae bacterium]|nr:hypothetical protein [Planctomycetaceae bacterium]